MNSELTLTKSDIIHHLKNKLLVSEDKNERLILDNTELKKKVLRLQKYKWSLKNKIKTLQAVLGVNDITVTNKNIDTIDIVLIEVCKHFGMSIDVIKKFRSRQRSLVEVRQICHYFAKKYTRLSLSVIGSIIGGMNYATVLYSDKVVKDQLFYDKALQSLIKKISARIEANITIKNIKKSADVDVCIYIQDKPIRLRNHIHKIYETN